ncbi:hypothetical protein ACFWE3_10790 [Mycobacteriaceae bacterium NPDC060252]
MAWGISTYLANKWLDHLCRNVAYTPPATVYAKFHTNAGDPGANGTANASANATRYACTFAAAAAGLISQSNTPEHTLNATETIGGVSFWDNPTAGNFLWSSAALTTKSGTSGDIIRINTDTLTFAPLAT